jgi:ATP-dependent Clp protease ATP-binding subunit ClpA
MTSNVGSSSIKDTHIGFSVHARGPNNEEARKNILDALRAMFRPEFLNRVDDIIVFNTLSRENLERIIQIQLKKVVALLAERGLKLELTQAADDLLMAEGYDPQYGARPMRRAIQRLIQDPLAMQLLSGQFKAGDTVVADADPRTRTLRFEKQEQNRDREGADKEAVSTL